jgi:pyridoxine 4-dehydrogenase
VYINEYVQQGLLSGISLSETSGNTVLKALKVANISCVELELSFFTRDIVEDGVLKVCSENNIPIIAYSPVGRGMLTDYAVEHADELYETTRKDLRSWMERFSEENYKANIAACKKLYDFAHDVKKTSLEALALSWILKVSEAKNLWGIEKVCKIIPIPSVSTKEKADMNFGHLVELTDAEFKQLEKIYQNTTLQGSRANAHMIQNMLV